MSWQLMQVGKPVLEFPQPPLRYLCFRCHHARPAKANGQVPRSAWRQDAEFALVYRGLFRDKVKRAKEVTLQGFFHWVAKWIPKLHVQQAPAPLESERTFVFRASHPLEDERNLQHPLSPEHCVY